MVQHELKGVLRYQKGGLVKTTANKALISAREKTGLTQGQVANEAKITARVYQYYEAGERKPNVYTAQLIANALNVAVDDIFPLNLTETE